MSSTGGRLGELCAEHGLGPEARGALEALLEQLADEHAPTTVRDPARALETHVADSLAGLAVAQLATAGVVADIGAGAGLPGLVLAAARPQVRFVEVESARRKCAFIERAAAAMGLRNVSVACARAEEWRDGFGRFEAVVARALAPLPVIVEYAAPLLADGGALVAWKAAPGPDEVADGAAAAAILGLEPRDPVVLPPTARAEHRSLYVYLKVRSLPNGYPRRPGMASKRPLRASTSA
jgi:16S rRNA (guanine527-N7)-methyltransferase